MKALYPFQEEAVAKILAASGFILADECGLGKTITAIEIAKRSRNPEAPYWQCLVICPPVLIPQWIDEISEQDPEQQIMIVDRLPWNYAVWKGYVLMSIYDLTSPIVRDALTTHLFDMVVVDEAHRMKNRQTKTAKWIKLIPAARKLCLTGTPMEKTAADLWSMLNYVAPEEFKAYWHYVMGYLQVHEGYFERFIIGGPKDDGAFGALLRPYMLRRTKEEVAPQLPERIDIVEHVALGLKQGELYDAFKKQKDIVVVVDDKEMLIKNALVLLVRLQQLSAWPPLLDFPPTVLSGKLEWLREFLEDHPDDRMVIFTRFRALALEIARVHNASLVIGGQKELDGNPRLLVGTIDAMGEGLNLGWAKHAIFLDSHWSTIKMTQAIDRIHRIDVIEPKNIYLLWSSKEDLLVLKALEHKWSEAELVYHFIKDLN